MSLLRVEFDDRLDLISLNENIKMEPHALVEFVNVWIFMNTFDVVIHGIFHMQKLKSV